MEPSYSSSSPVSSSPSPSPFLACHHHISVRPLLFHRILRRGTLCGTGGADGATQTLDHLFNCPAHPTTLDVGALWDSLRDTIDHLRSFACFDLPPLGTPLRPLPLPPSPLNLSKSSQRIRSLISLRASSSSSSIFSTPWRPFYVNRGSIITTTGYQLATKQRRYAIQNLSPRI